VGLLYELPLQAIAGKLHENYRNGQGDSDIVEQGPATYSPPSKIIWPSAPLKTIVTAQPA